MQLGKIPISVLNRTVLRKTGARSRALLTGPKAGVDFAAIRISGGYLIVSSDPVTGVAEGIGSYAVTVSSNDVATSGNRPQFVGSVVLLPEGARERDLETIASDMDHTAKRLGIAIVGGHTEVTPGLKRPIVTITTFSYAQKFVCSDMARTGDALLMTKTAGIEGTAVLARDLGEKLPRSLVERATRLEKRISIVEEAVRAFRTGEVKAMHDCTEGGVLGAAYEMSLASGVGFEMREDEIPIAKETAELCGLLNLDPLKLIGSGALLIAAPQGAVKQVRRALAGIAPVAEVGRFTRRGRLLVSKEGTRRTIRAAPEDELWRSLARLA